MDKTIAVYHIKFLISSLAALHGKTRKGVLAGVERKKHLLSAHCYFFSIGGCPDGLYKLSIPSPLSGVNLFFRLESGPYDPHKLFITIIMPKNCKDSPVQSWLFSNQPLVKIGSLNYIIQNLSPPLTLFMHGLKLA